MAAGRSTGSLSKRRGTSKLETSWCHVSVFHFLDQVTKGAIVRHRAWIVVIVHVVDFDFDFAVIVSTLPIARSVVDISAFKPQVIRQCVLDRLIDTHSTISAVSVLSSMLISSKKLPL